jgi:hypothetical protein
MEMELRVLIFFIDLSAPHPAIGNDDAAPSATQFDGNTPEQGPNIQSDHKPWRSDESNKVLPR